MGSRDGRSSAEWPIPGNLNNTDQCLSLADTTRSSPLTNHRSVTLAYALNAERLKDAAASFWPPR
jgi:hypothetical protein